MSIFNRLFKIGQAKVNQVVDSLEDPGVMLEQAIRDKEKQLVELRKSVASCIANVRQTEAQVHQEKSEQKKWEVNAESALKANKEDLAVKALSRAKEHEEHANQLEVNLKNQQADVEKLKGDLGTHQNQLAEYKRNKDFIAAQAKFADAKKAIQAARSVATRGKDVDDLMERMKKKAETSRYEADALEELTDSKSTLDEEFENLSQESTDSEIQSKLAEMKAKLGK